MSISEHKTKQVKFCDLTSAVSAHRQEFVEAFARTLDSGWFILGREVAAFEEEFASIIGSTHAVGVANGTDAIELSLRVLDIGPGDTVITVSHTAVATVAAIERTGATPAFVDIDQATLTMSPESLAEMLAYMPKGAKAKAIIPVHIYGQMADMEAIAELAKHYGLWVIEDCAQAHGAKLNDRVAGSYGDLGAFSFYPTKNLGAFGDGGGVVTDNNEMYRRLLRLRQYGWKKRFISEESGINSRLDELQAAMLRINLKYLEENNQRRRYIADRYDEVLMDLPNLVAPQVRSGVHHVYHLYVLRLARRQALVQYLAEMGIETAIHYPVPIHQQPAYLRKILLPPGGLPVTEAVCSQILSLPLYPEMPKEDVGLVCQALRDFVTKQR